MSTRKVKFQSADDPSQIVSVLADPQTAVTPGDESGTAVVTTPDGGQFRVVGDYKDVHVKIQAAAAMAHQVDTELN